MHIGRNSSPLALRFGKLKRYAGFPYEMYDGYDPEGNVFQVMQFD